MSDLSGLVQGISQGLTSYVQADQQQQKQQQNYAFQKQQDLQEKEDLSKFGQSTQGDITPDFAAQTWGSISPEFGQAASKAAQDFYKQNGRYLKTDEADKVFDPIMKAYNLRVVKAQSGVDKNSQEQDKLEKQAQDRLVQVRGDQSLMRAESQRDAAGLAYDTIAKAQSEGRDLSQMEYTDLLGQLWKVRTGSSPTEQVLKELDQRTAKEGFNRAMTYVTGNPNLVGATTTDTLANIKQFVDSSGQKADQQWGAYMQPRLTKPTSLEQSRWEHIVQANRGLAYSEQKSVSDKTYPAGNGVEAKKAALRKKLGL